MVSWFYQWLYIFELFTEAYMGYIFHYDHFKMQAFVTDQDKALEELFGNVDNSKRIEKCLDIMATRIATVFASMKVVFII